MSIKSMARSGAEGNTRLQKMYGAESTPPRQDYPKGYATGGAVKPYAGGGMVNPSADGAPAKPRMSKPGRKMGKGGKKAGTNVNVVIMPKPDGAKPSPDMAGGPAPGPGPMGMAPPAPAPMPPPDAGGPPMPMRAKGGRVQAVNDGDEGQTQGAERGAMKLVEGRKTGGKVNAEDHTSGQDTGTEREAMNAITRKSGGKVMHDDAAEDRKMIKSMVKPAALTGKKEGGKVMVMHAGANSGPGRIEKAAKQKRA